MPIAGAAKTTFKELLEKFEKTTGRVIGSETDRGWKLLERLISNKTNDEAVKAVTRHLERSSKAIERTLDALAKNPVASGFEDTLVTALAEGTWAGIKAGGRNIAKAFTAGERWQNFGKQIVTGMAANAMLSGTLEWAQGGSFWEGFKGGILPGAFYGGLYATAKAFVGLPGAAGDFRRVGSRISRQVRAIGINGAGVEAAKTILGLKGI